MLKVSMDDHRGTPLEVLEPLLQEIGFIAGCEGEFVPKITINDHSLCIELDGPHSFVYVNITEKETPTDV